MCYITRQLNDLPHVLPDKTAMMGAEAEAVRYDQAGRQSGSGKSGRQAND